MEQKILQLIELIGEEVVIFEKFVELLNRQQEALVANDMELLATVTQEQERLALATSQVEKRRAELVRTLSHELNRDSNDINLTELAKLVAEPELNQLRTLQTTLIGLHNQISTIKSRNDFLIRKSIQRTYPECLQASRVMVFSNVIIWHLTERFILRWFSREAVFLKILFKTGTLTGLTTNRLHPGSVPIWTWF